jgi:hypothetical protein
MCVGRAITFLGSLALLASTVFAQSVRIDRITQFKEPYVVVPGAIAQLPDGRIFGFYGGGLNGAVYQATPDGHGGYTSAVVFEMPQNAGGVPDNAFAADNVVAVGPDGKIYFATDHSLSRFDPDALTVQDLVAVGGRPVALFLGNDGHTLFGAFYQGAIYSYDTATSTYHDLGNTGDPDVIGMVQMKDGTLFTTTLGSLEGFVVTMRWLDPATGVPRAAPLLLTTPTTPFVASIGPTKGDDGETYAVTLRPFAINRVDPACFCLRQMASYANSVIDGAFSVVGPRNGKLYLDANGVPTSVDISVNPPVITKLATLAHASGYRLLPDGTLAMFEGATYVLDTQRAVPNATPTPSFAPIVPNDGVDGFPSSYTQGADGLLYGLSDSGSGMIFRVDPVAKTHAEVAAGQDGTRMVLGADGALYYTGAQSIVRFDPSTDAVDVLRTFATDPDTGLPGPDGAFPFRLHVGSDGLLHGVIGEENTPDFSGGLFTFDPASGSYVNVPVTNFEFGFYPNDPLVETSPGIWIGTYTDADPNFAVCGKAYRFDQSTLIVTSLGAIGDANACPSTFARSADGPIVAVAADFTDSTSVFVAVDPNSGALTPLASMTQSPGGDLALASDGMFYTAYTSPDNVPGVLRFNPSTDQITDLGLLPPGSRGFGGYGVTPGRDGRIFLSTAKPWVVYAYAVLDPIPVAAASGGYGLTTTVSATLKALGVPLAGRTLAFTLNGHAVGSAITNAQGVAALHDVNLFGIAIGTYASAIGASFAGDDEFPPTSGTGSLTVLDLPTPGLMAGDGFVRDGDFRYDFAFVVREKGDGTDRGGFALRVTNTDGPPKGKKKPKPRNDTFVSISFSNVAFSDDPTIRPGKSRRPQVDTVQFAGPGFWNGQSGYRFEATAQDAGEPGRHRESIGVTVYDGANRIVVQFDGVLDGGNIQSIRIRH